MEDELAGAVRWLHLALQSLLDQVKSGLPVSQAELDFCESALERSLLVMEIQERRCAGGTQQEIL